MLEFEFQKMPEISFLLDRSNKITFETKNLNLEQFQSLKDGKTYVVTIKEYKNNRSNSQNKYFWQLINLLAAKINKSAEDLYRQYIKEAGKFVVITLAKNAVEDFRTNWEKGHLGNLIVEYKENDKFQIVLAYYGSSSYNTEEMSKLIDAVIQDCQSVGIPTLSISEFQELRNDNDRR